MPATLSDLPQVNAVLAQPNMQPLVTQFGHAQVVQAIRAYIADLRSALLIDASEQELPDFTAPSFAQQIVQHIEAAQAPSLRPVINATGILIHTNLGRAPMAPAAHHAMQAAATGFSNLEYDLETGKRGSRHTHVEDLICDLTGAQAAVVVNNCAAAVLLSLVATAAGRSVVASRGELIEIGGSYRLPDVIVQSGATLREVGTTNKTRVGDYADAIDDTTAVLLKSHTSNFKIIGFTAAPSRQELSQLASSNEVILMEDLGSGVLIDLSPYGLEDEPVVRDILSAGVDLVMFSGDKMLGGPQAGIIAGRSDLVAALKAHPLMRAVRIDKLSLAALEATLRLYRAPNDPMADVPVLRMLSEPSEQVQKRAQAVANAMSAAGLDDVVVSQTVAHVGAGSLPTQELVSYAVSIQISTMSADALMKALRQSNPPVIGRIERDRVLLDMRTVDPSETATLVAALERINTL